MLINFFCYRAINKASSRLEHSELFSRILSCVNYLNSGYFIKLSKVELPSYNYQLLCVTSNIITINISVVILEYSSCSNLRSHRIPEYSSSLDFCLVKSERISTNKEHFTILILNITMMENGSTRSFVVFVLV